MAYGKTQRGFSLVETMISMVIGLLVIAGASTIYVSTVSSSTATLKSSKINQELAALMNVMTNDIRRAGYWGISASNVNNPHTNPFATVDNTALEVMDDMTNSAQVAVNSVTGGECIVYTYDADDDGNLDNGDIVGFRLNNGVVQMRQRGNVTANPDDHDNCNDADDTWLDVTDGYLITVSNLNFSLGNAQCQNTEEPNGVDDDADGSIDNAAEADCYVRAPSSGDITVETRQVTISVTGFLASDTDTTLTLTEDVRVRNDLVRVR